MSTNEQKLTPRHPSTAAPATANSTSRAQQSAASAVFKTLHRPFDARKAAPRCTAAKAAKQSDPESGRHELATIETARPRSAPGETRDVPITVLTADTAMSDAIKAAVAGCHPVFTVGSADEAAALATAGRCPILITDQALTRPALTRITTTLRAHEPALVTIAVGNRGEDNALIGLLSSGAADRLMLKPVTAALARIVIESAVREHRIQRARSRSELAPRTAPAAIATEPPPDVIDESSSPTLIDEPRPTRTEQSPQPTALETVVALAAETPRTPRQLSRQSWVVIAAALTVVICAAWWWMTSPQRPPIEQPAAIETNLENAQARGGIDRTADRYADEAQTLLRAGRLAEAGLALERARRARPDHPRLSALDQELRAGINGILVRVRESEARAEALKPRDPPTPAMPARATPRAAQESKVNGAAAPPSVRSEPRPTHDEPARATLPATQAVALHQPNAARELIDEAQTALDRSLLANVQPPSQRVDSAATASAPMTPAEPVTPKLAKFVRPEYPNEAAMRGFEGWVDVGLDVTAAGDVVNARIEDSSSGRMFHRAALVAVRQWKYEPRAASAPTQYVQVRLEFKRSQ